MWMVGLLFAARVWAQDPSRPPAAEALAYQPPTACRGATGRLDRIEAADQADRVGWSPRIARRDARRLRVVHRLLARARVCTPHEHSQAAVVLLHSLAPADHLQAHVLATWAANQGDDGARWISAAAFDRWRVSRGLSQWYGTQMRQDNGHTCLIELVGDATDADRAAMAVPPLSDLVEKVARQAGVTLQASDLTSLGEAGLTCPAVAWSDGP